MSPSRDRLVVLGAGGHAKVVVATALEAGLEVVGLYDDDESKWGGSVLGIPIRGSLETAQEQACSGIIAVGDNRQRQEIASRHDMVWSTVIHPRAIVHPSVQLGPGAMIFAGVVLQPEVSIGRHVIVNTATSVDHDCRIADWVHCAPGVHLAGSVTVADGALLGIGSVVIPGVRIGAWSVLGAGSTAVSDLADGEWAAGNPARPLERNSRRPQLESRRAHE